MAKHTPKVRIIQKQYTRAEVLESLAYELKPFVLATVGFAGGLYFQSASLPLAKFFSLLIMGCGLFILYARAKDRGVIN